MRQRLIHLGSIVVLAIGGCVALQHSLVKIFPSVAHIETQCVAQKTESTKENPNSMLFISCGGFL
ncbi:MAG: hypothetical protein WA021_03355 [Minisyncoccia bacterium]